MQNRLDRVNQDQEEEDAAYDWIHGSRFGEAPILINRVFGTLWHRNGENR